MASTAFDVLMAGSRAAGKKKSLPRKRKIVSSCAGDSPDSALKTQGLGFEKTVIDQSPSENNDGSCSNSKTKMLKLWNFKEGTAQDLIKSKISLLKTVAADFEPKSVACWENEDGGVPFLFLCLMFDLISQESGRKNVNIACNMLRTVMQISPGDLLAVVHISANKIAPKHVVVRSDLGVGENLIIKVLAQTYGIAEDRIKSQFKILGDLGKTAETIRSSQSVVCKARPLTVTKVLETLLLICKESGKSSTKKKMDLIKALFIAAVGCEIKYIVRLLMPKTGSRIGFAESTLLEALGHAAVYNENPTPKLFPSTLKKAAMIVKQAHSVCPLYDKLISGILSGGVWDLPKICCFSVGVPIEPMLAVSIGAVSEVFKKIDGEEYCCEYKYDGERAQIHYMDDGLVEIYSRNLERSTEKYPDVVISISRLKKPFIKSFVLDCEIVAYDNEEQEILPFQILSTRRRKNVAVNDIKVDVCIFAFDMLYLNGHSLIKEQLSVRKKHLYESFDEEPGFLQFTAAKTSGCQKEIESFLYTAFDACCEGLVIKSLDGTYEPAMRSCNWLKLKKDYMEGIGDSLDLVPIAAYHGQGKRTGVYGAFLLACYDSGSAEFESICRIGSGFSTKMLKEISSRLNSKLIPKPKSYYRYVAAGKVPDVWFEPSEVWEVKVGRLTISPIYCAAIGRVEHAKNANDFVTIQTDLQRQQSVANLQRNSVASSVGLSVRFPILVRLREDKDTEQASSPEQIAEMYHKQFTKSTKL